MKRLTGYCSVLATLGFLLWFLTRDGEEGRVKAVIEKARAVATWSGHESQLKTLADISRLDSVLTRDVQVRVDVLGGLRGALVGAEDVRTSLLASRQHIPKLEVKILDLTVTFPDPKHARVELTANFATDKPKEINPQEFLVQLQKNEGSWYIDRIETVRTLQSQ